MFACKYCVLIKGVTAKELLHTEEDLFKHIEREHHIPVQREDETREQAIERFQAENPEAGGPNCKCPTCTSKVSIWELLRDYYKDNQGVLRVLSHISEN